MCVCVQGMHVCVCVVYLLDTECVQGMHVCVCVCGVSVRYNVCVCVYRVCMYVCVWCVTLYRIR